MNQLFSVSNKTVDSMSRLICERHITNRREKQTLLMFNNNNNYETPRFWRMISSVLCRVAMNGNFLFN